MWRKVFMRERENKKELVYCLRWYDEAGKERGETVGPNPNVAERCRVKKEYELNHGLTGSVRRIRLEDFVREHLEISEGRVSASYLRDQKSTLTQFLSSVENRWLDKISSQIVDDWFSGRLRKVSLACANKNLRTLKAVFSQAVKRGHMNANPCCSVKQLKEPDRDIRVLSFEEAVKLLEACPNLRWRVFIALALQAGPRSGELCALEWDDLDLEEGVLLIRNKPGHLTKSRRNRVLGIMPGTVEDLRTLQKSSNGSPHVFQTKDGGPMKNNLRRDFAKIVKKAGIAHCSLHDLRKSFASSGAMRGVNAAIIQKALGHASIQTTLKYYTNVLPEAVREAQERLPYAELLKSTVSKSCQKRNLRVVEKSA